MAGTAPAEGVVAEAAMTLDNLATSVAVVTLLDKNQVHRGMTVSSLTRVSADPPSVLICVAETASMLPHLVMGQRVAISVLADDQAVVSAGFGYASDDPFTDFTTFAAEDGSRVVADNAGYMLGRIGSVVHESGTAVVFIEIDGGKSGGGNPLVYWRKGYCIGPEHQTGQRSGRW